MLALQVYDTRFSLIIRASLFIYWRAQADATAHMWESEDSLWEMVLSRGWNSYHQALQQAPSSPETSGHPT